MQLTNLFVFASTLAVTSAFPARPRCSTNSSATITAQATSTATSSATPSATSVSNIAYVLPTNGGATPLASPPTGSVLQHIAVGHGIQNYTCTAAGVNGTSIGALAVLYDATSLYPGSGSDSLSQADWDSLTSKVLRTTSMPIDQSNGAASPFPADAALTVDGVAAPLPYLARHYFDSNKVPTFDLSPALFKGSKTTDILAPSSSDKGLTDEGAVDWLALSDAGGSVTINMVYRVLTSGGFQGICAAAGDSQSVPYTAMYWFYAPSA
ncbi:hypothetical protein F5Y18DRAFT_20363 [Xylariaceae sp. FL1019]|nr:hypothetical protein F5Y18DRAFT_20363 [Xylariaceae sp. FL1019]